MKRLFICLLLVLTIVGCTDKTQTIIYQALPENVYSDGEFEFSEWSGYRWFVIPLMNESQEYCSKYIYAEGTNDDLPIILKKITDELGEPIAEQVTNPEQLAKYASAPNVFILPNNRALEESETLYWWDTEEYVVSLLESKEHPEVGMVAYTIVALYEKSKLP